MIRKFSLAVALVVAASVAAPAFAGGGGGGGSKSAYTVRVKNNGTETEAVAVTQGATSSLVGSKTLAANQVGQWSVNKGQFTVGAYSSAGVAPTGGNPTLTLTTGAAKRIYILAAVDTTADVATITGSPSTF